MVKPTHFPDIPVVLAGSLTNIYIYSGFKNVKSYPKSYFLTTEASIGLFHQYSSTKQTLLLLPILSTID